MLNHYLITLDTAIQSYNWIIIAINYTEIAETMGDNVMYWLDQWPNVVENIE